MLLEDPEEVDGPSAIAGADQAGSIHDAFVRDRAQAGQSTVVHYGKTRAVVIPAAHLRALLGAREANDLARWTEAQQIVAAGQFPIGESG